MSKKNTDIKSLLNKLILLPTETECVEFKNAEKDFDFRKLGKYFSALSNEANLKNQPCGWLIFGVDNKRNIVGTQYRNKNKAALEKLKNEVATQTTGGITFMGIYEIYQEGKRVILFQIPPAPRVIPTAWQGHYYGRDGESLGALNLYEFEQIRSQSKIDWSAQICKEATINDLDETAIKRARILYKEKFPTKANEVDQWDDVTFLNKAKITKQGKITRTAIVLLGKEESTHFITPSVARISWILQDEQGDKKDYQHFDPPFLLNTDALYAKIRNLVYRYLSNNSLFPTEVMQYDTYVIRETLHNCIAHQDYELKGRITVVEKPDELLFTNLGSFIPGSVERVIEMDSPAEWYRNQFLAQAMVNLNMIDTIGGGIKKMFRLQRERYFPMPDYDLSDTNKVVVRIFGKIIDENYTRLLIENAGLEIKTVIELDKVQKKIRISFEQAKFLKSQKLIEGRRPNCFVSARIAGVTGDRAFYIKNRSFDDQYFKDLIISYIRKYQSATRKDIELLLVEKLSDILNESQKHTKISNLLKAMARDERTIKNAGSRKKPKWILN